MLTSLGVFSTNESVDELGDGEMVFMSLGWVVAECEGKGGLGGTADRIEALGRSEVKRSYFRVNWLTSALDSYERILGSLVVIRGAHSRGASRELFNGFEWLISSKRPGETERGENKAVQA